MCVCVCVCVINDLFVDSRQKERENIGEIYKKDKDIEIIYYNLIIFSFLLTLRKQKQ